MNKKKLICINYTTYILLAAQSLQNMIFLHIKKYSSEYFAYAPIFRSLYSIIFVVVQYLALSRRYFVTALLFVYYFTRYFYWRPFLWNTSIFGAHISIVLYPELLGWCLKAFRLKLKYFCLRKGYLGIGWYENYYEWGDKLIINVLRK